MEFIRKLPIPKDIKEMYPISDELKQIKEKRDTEIRSVFEGTSSKFVLIIGPCSADRKETVLKYISLLKPVADDVKDKLLIIPRVYTNKPRSSGIGYMGMLHQPDPIEMPDLLKGLLSIRELHLSILRDYGFTCADELLYPDNYRYLSDLLSYVAIGARSVENQYHRLVASGLDIPVGMKNPISGDLSVMYNSINAARHSHAFLYRGWEVVTHGNSLVHGVLRGYKDINGHNQPNCSYDYLCSVLRFFEREEIYKSNLIIDTNHSNSNKDYSRQIEIALDVMQSRKKNFDLRAMIKGLMIESYLKDGSQSEKCTEEGLSITDPCLGWDKTKDLIYRIADAI